MQQLREFCSSIPKLDVALGENLGRGKLILVGGLQGGGKTILAGQFSRDFAVDGHEVLFLSSEVSHEALTKRNLSAICSIPYDQIKDGVNAVTVPTEGDRRIDLPDPAAYGEDAVKKALPVLEALARHFTFKKFKPKGFDPRQEFDDLVGGYLAEKERLPDVLIYDYLWYPQVERAQLDPVKMRGAAVAAGEVLKELAVAHKMLVVVFCQVDPGLLDRKKVDPVNLRDFKDLWQPADAFVGISQRYRDESDDFADGMYERVQHLNVMTKDSLAPVLVAVDRAFEFQRFEPCKWRPQQKPEDMGELERRARVIERTAEFPGYVLARRKKFYEIFDCGCPYAINLYAFTLLVARTAGLQAGVSFYSRKSLTAYLGLSSKQLRAATDTLADQGYLDVPRGKIRQSLRYHVAGWNTDQTPSIKGFFKLFKNLRDTSRADLLSDPATFRVWLYLLADARSFPDEVSELKPGELLLKRHQMQENLVLDGKQLDDALGRLEQRGSIAFQTGNVGKVTIPNWHLYQVKVYEHPASGGENIEV